MSLIIQCLLLATAWILVSNELAMLEVIFLVDLNDQQHRATGNGNIQGSVFLMSWADCFVRRPWSDQVEALVELVSLDAHRLVTRLYELMLD